MSTKIEWTEETWNPVTGCTPVSDGCAHCYAQRMARRLAGRCGYPAAPNHFDVTLHTERLLEPLSWRKPRRVFVNSMSDTFHDDVPDEFIDRIWAVMAACPQHTFQVLTKRPERMREYLAGINSASRMLSPYGKPTLPEPIYEATRWLLNELGGHWQDSGAADCWLDRKWPTALPNVTLMVTAENQAAADARIPLLQQCPAAVRGVSLEPLLGPVDLGDILTPVDNCSHKDAEDGCCHHPDCRSFGGECHVWSCPLPDAQQPLHWIIVGGESGPGARPMHPAWVRSIRNQCEQAGVPFFFKQWGDWAHNSQLNEIPRGAAKHTWDDGVGSVSLRVGKARAGHLLDGVEYWEYPEVRNV